ncbi:MAG TPA: hypothetical protein VLL48_09145 [Longimicrobiales bacterium]|nr:hypothetical protein [Longimicrobiales bacterium]
MTTTMLALAAGAVAPVGAQDTEDFQWEGRLEAGRLLEVKGVNGRVEAEPATGATAVVRAEKRGDRSDPREVRIEVVEHADGVTICAVYPHPRGRNGCEPGRDWESSVRDNDVRVHFSVRVPPGVRFYGGTVNGDVEIRDLDADVEARTVNGGVEVSTRGMAEASTVNGSIRALMGRAPDRPVKFRTVNGAIELDLPDGAGVDVDAEWVNGGLESDLPVTLTGRVSRRHLRGRIGDGGPLMELSTVNGSIRIR